MSARNSALTTASSRFDDSGCIPQPVPYARSFISKLTSGRSRARAEFYFHPSVSHRKYAPGDTVKGHVVVQLQKPMRVTHVVVRLQGYVQVFKGRASAKRPTPSRTMKAGDYNSGTLMLFDEEKVICGEERLESGTSEIPFELKFPDGPLPSSLDCERGTICYLLRSVLTRPTGLASAITAEIDLTLEENVDVAYVHPPKPRMISLEPLRRRRTKRMPSSKDPKPVATPSTVTTARPAASEDGEMTIEASTDHDLGESGPRSPSPSHISHGSVTTSSAASQVPGTATPNRTITASMELHRAGCLKGDMLPVKVIVTHTKAVKSMMGVIVTLIRQARFDTSPIWPDDPTLDNRSAEKQKHNEYYPKSLLGLGGLSLSSDGTARTFRKDLAQTIAPLMVDDKTLTCTVKAAVRVPEDAFPTITCVPGLMVSFRYFVEVVVDLGGKLDGQDRYLPGLNPVNLSLDHGTSDSMLASWSGGVVDTDQIRRIKSVVSCRFEVLVGTLDSRRTAATASARKQEQHHTHETHIQSDHIEEEGYDVISPESLELYERPAYYPADIEEQEEPYHVPAPEIEQHDSSMDEKTRVRLAEQRLMPSAPEYGEPSSSSASAPEPSAPTAEHLQASAPHLDPLHEDHDHEAIDFDPAPVYATDGPSHLPGLGDVEAGPSSAAPAIVATDDKQELQRRRLLMEASAPPGDEVETHAETPPEVPQWEHAEPSAPVLDDVEPHLQGQHPPQPPRS